MQRRQFLGLAMGGAFAGILARAVAATELKEIRIGYQKSGIFPAIKQRRTLEGVFNPLGIDIKWAEFTFGPPLLEGIATGNLDYGYTGDAPPVFAQAAGANLDYVAVLPRHASEGIIVPEESPIQTLADLKGKRIGFGKASSAHTTTLAALDKAGLAYTDIKPVYLPPADAASAFARGAIDAWTIWDPFLAIAQRGKVRTLAYAKDVHDPNNFLLANRNLVTQHPEIVNKFNDVFAQELQWADTHRDELAELIHEASGVDLESMRVAMKRSAFTALPVSEEITAKQQAVADRFYKAGLLPKPIAVRDIVWKWTPGA